MSSSNRDRRKITTSLMLVIMFLFADLALPQAIPEWSNGELQEENLILRTTTTFNATQDSGIHQTSLNSSMGNQTEGLGSDFGNRESRLLFSFNNSVPSGDMVTGATLNLTCGVDNENLSEINIFTSRIKKSWNEANVSWYQADNSTPWQFQGADGVGDRGDWEPPFYGYGNNTFQINVTSIVQDAVINSRNTIEILVSATNGYYTCHMSESADTNSRPSLIIKHQLGNHSSGGMLTPNFVDNGAALMNENKFLLTAATNPKISWENMTGNHAEVQISKNPGFKSDTDDFWYYNSVVNSSLFTFSSTSGEMTIPAVNELTNSTTMYYRMRATDSTHTVGQWESGFFHLPGHTAVQNGNYGTVNIDSENLGLSEYTFIETFVNSSMKNSNMGSDSNFTVGTSPSSEQYGLMRINLDDVGLHTNSSIIDATLALERIGFTDNAEVSIHAFYGEEWTENGATWRKYDGVNGWNDGGRVPSMSVGSFDGNQSSSNIDVNLTVIIQKWIDDNNAALALGLETSSHLDLMLVASTFGIDSTTTKWVTICSSDAFDCNGPSLSITYDWDSNGPPTIPDHTSPSDGAPVWNLTGHNLSGNTTPTLTWDGTINWSGDMLMQISTDMEYRNIIRSFNTATSTEFNSTDGTWSIPGNDALEEGVLYHWRLAQIDSTSKHHSWWSTSSFLVSGLESEHIQNDDHRLRLSQGNATTAGDAPSCEDTFIDSGSPSTNYNDENELMISYNTAPSETVVLIGCDLTSHMLPQGYAVKSATLKMRLAGNPGGTPSIGAWESLQNNWSEDSATWTTYDGTNPWGTSGAKGWEKSSLLDSASISSFSNGDWIEWDITLAVQNAMREGRSVDLILGIIDAGSGNNREAFLYPNSANSANRPEISFVYVPGSDAIPSNPTPVLPLNGSWSIEQGINPEPNQNPQLTWNYTANSANIGGWSVELDTSPNFDSSNIIMATSWNNVGFDVINQTYNVSTALDKGETWYWRVRATSTTNQIGSWSNAFHFLLPDITTWSIDSNRTAVEIRHREAMPSLNLPNFIDTWVADSGVGATSDQSSSSSFKVGTDISGSNATGLLKIPLTELPNPQGAHISKAVLNLYAQFGSSTNNAVSIHPALVPWNTSANGTTYDGVNNWSMRGAMGDSDRGMMSDIKEGEASWWMNFDVTELVQHAFANGETHLSIMVVGSIGKGQTTFTSSEGNSNNKPWLNLTWSVGNASTPEVAGVNSYPVNDEITWDTSTHALLPKTNNPLTWSHPNSGNVDDWRIYIWNNYSDERDGWEMYDSRDSTVGWDLTNLTWTPPTGLKAGDSWKWFVQPITDDILGAKGNQTIFHIPENTGTSINSTDAELTLKQGQLVKALDYPAIFMDTYLDSASTNSAYESSNELIIGRSPLTNSSNFATSSNIMLNWSSLPIPNSHEFIEATLTLSKLSGGESNQETIRIAVCELFNEWDENATYNSPNGNSTTWPVEHCDTKFEMSTLNYNDNSVELNITYAVQHAHSNGLDKVNLGLWVIGDTFDDWRFASSDYTSDESMRPEVSLTWRTGNQWLPSQPTNLYPLDGATIWNETASRPRGAENTTLNWSSSENNETTWLMEFSTDPTFTNESNTSSYDFSDSNTFDGEWDLVNLSYTFENSFKGDYWIYWRVRAEQDHRLGKWSDVYSYRVPNAIGTDDGMGNNTVILYEGSVFSETGSLPSIPDSSIDSSAPNSTSSTGQLRLGLPSSGSGESRILLTFNLSELPFPSTMTPTNVLLSLHRYNVTGTSPLTVGVYACDTFNEDNLTWNSAPACSTNEITRSTLLVSPENGPQYWDITSLAQTNIASGNYTMSLMLKTVGIPSSSHLFYDSSHSDYSPKLFLDYVDNIDGIIPPAQPTLVYPPDGEILYNTSSWEISSLDKPQLTWNPVSNATGYILTVSNSSGENKYLSWVDPEINGTTFTFIRDLVPGEVYNWWVQAINGSIPGPSSTRSTFAIGNPVNNTYNNDHTWTYNFQTGNEVEQLGHTNIRDSYIGSGDADVNHGSDSLVVGTDCEGSNTECRMIFALDNSQIPLPSTAMVHSASINLQIDTAPIGPVTLTVYRLITNSWSQSGSTWDNSEVGVPWSTGGLSAGIEYDMVPISEIVVLPGDTEVWLDIGHTGMQINGDSAWIVIPDTSSSFPAHIEFYSSEELEVSGKRPMIVLNYTDVNSVSISPTGPTTNADTGLQFSHMLSNATGGMIVEDVVWSVAPNSSGSISPTGLYTPELEGVHTVLACFGVICTQESITVTPGAPVLLQTTETEATITADETYNIEAYVVDQYGNQVLGEAISFTPTNGSMVGTTFYPYNAGNQTVTIGWNLQTIDLTIIVIGGEPVYYEATGCEGIIKAGTTCQLNWTLHDQFGNMLDLADGGGITWTVGGGTFTESNRTFFAETVGNYFINMTSTEGLYYEISIEIDHGEMVILEIIPSSTFVTADEIVYLNTTRIDIMGNRLPVLIPQENWTTSDGTITVGEPAQWDPQRRGSKTISASYAGISNSVSIQVTEGEIAELILVIDSVEQEENTVLNITADDEIIVKVKARDSDGNKWTVNVAWNVEHIQYNDQGVLQEQIYGSTTRFVPVFSSSSEYTLRATYSDANLSISLQATIDIFVSQGDLVRVSLIQPTELNQNIDSDQSILFMPELTDGDGNGIDSSIISYEIKDLDSGETSNITSVIVGNSGVWEASEVGNYSITAWAISNADYNISETVTMSVTHGKAVTVEIDVIADTAKAGDVYTLTITGTDADGNTFLESVLWTKDNKAVPGSTIEGSGGIYNWSATKAGQHTFKFRSPSGAEAEWTVTVSAHQTVNRIELTILQESVLQLESFDIEVKTFDAWENEIPVPPETQVKLTGRMTAESVENGKWTITTLDDEEQTVTISVHNKEVSAKIQVDGTFMGFFEAGGTLYYAGGVLAILVVIVLLVVIIMVLRSGSSEYDDDDDDDDDDDYESDDSDEASVGGAGPSGPPPFTGGGKEDWMMDYRVDDDNVEWGEDQDGNWWYRDPGTSDWSEWSD